MRHLYIVLYSTLKYSFLLIFNTLDIEVHYDCYSFSMHRVYSGRNFYIYITPYLIESTLELLVRTGVDLCTHDQYLCMNIVLCSSANCSNKSADDEVGLGGAFGVKCKIAQYRSISLTTQRAAQREEREADSSGHRYSSRCNVLLGILIV